jgi:hypothetical protein
VCILQRDLLQSHPVRFSSSASQAGTSCWLKNHVIHIAGTRMICQGTDGLSLGDMLTGVMGGAYMLTFIHLALTAFELQPELMERVEYWWGTGNTSWLTPDGWYAESGLIGKYVWCPHPRRPMQHWTNCASAIYNALEESPVC